MSWSGWSVSPNNAAVFPGLKVNVFAGPSDKWVHYLVAPADEKDPNANHIHVKIALGSETYVLAAVKSKRNPKNKPAKTN